MPQISVIVPVYKVEPYLRRCVDSILCQTFTDFELILVDDGSPDGCPAICDEYAAKDHRVVVIHQPNGGLSAARNAGIDWAFTNSDCQWLSFIDSDDWVHPRYLELLLAAARKYDVNISISGYTQTSGNEPIVNLETLTPGLWKTEDFYTSNTTNATIACAKLYRKDCFSSIRYPVGKLHEDEYTTYRLLFAHSSLVAIAAPLYFYYHNPASITTSEWTPCRMEVMTAFDEQLAYFSNQGHPAALTRRVRSYLWMLNSQYHGACSAKNDYTAEIRCIRSKMKHILRHYARHIDRTWPEYAAISEIIHPIQSRIRSFLHRS